MITNQRIVVCFRPNSCSMRLSTAGLVNVQEVTAQRGGLLRAIVDFGDIVCRRAVNQDSRLAGIPRPREVQAIVDRERLRYT